jgi:mono/diheme cytochrome c family protein
MEEKRKEEYQKRYESFKREGHPFWPYSIFQDAVVALLVFIGLILLTIFWGVPLEERADPTNTAYIPRPEWYFMFLFQLLKLFPGYLEWVGVALIPSFLVLILLLLPFYDRRPIRAIRLRPLAMTMGVLAVAFLVSLTVLAIRSTPPAGGVYLSVGQGVGGSPRAPLTATQLEGRQLFRSQCAPCHSVGGEGGQAGPALDGVGSLYSADWLHTYIMNPKLIRPDSTMPAFNPSPEKATLTHEQIGLVVEYLKALR